MESHLAIKKWKRWQICGENPLRPAGMGPSHPPTPSHKVAAFHKCGSEWNAIVCLRRVGLPEKTAFHLSAAIASMSYKRRVPCAHDCVLMLLIQWVSN